MDVLNRKAFLKLVAAGGAMSVAAGGRAGNATPAFAKGAVELEPILKSAMIRAFNMPFSKKHPRKENP